MGAFFEILARSLRLPFLVGFAIIGYAKLFPTAVGLDRFILALTFYPFLLATLFVEARAILGVATNKEKKTRSIKGTCG